MYNPQIKTFIVVADAGSFNKAAEQLYVSSTAIIKQINLLESRVGVRLFERSHKGLSLTAAGKVFYKDAEHIMRYSENSLQRVKEAQRGNSGVVRIGLSPITPVDYLIEVISKLQIINKNIQFQVVPFENKLENARQILGHLGESIDIVMGIFDDSTEILYEKAQFLPIKQLPVSLMMSAVHELATKDMLDWPDLECKTVHIIRPGWSSAMDRLRANIEQNHKTIQIETFRFYDIHVFNNRISESDLVAGFDIWDKVYPFMVIKPVNWDYYMNYGLVYSREPSPSVSAFIDAVRGL